MVYTTLSQTTLLMGHTLPMLASADLSATQPAPVLAAPSQSSLASTLFQRCIARPLVATHMLLSPLSFAGCEDREIKPVVSARPDSVQSIQSPLEVDSNVVPKELAVIGVLVLLGTGLILLRKNSQLRSELKAKNSALHEKSEELESIQISYAKMRRLFAKVKDRDKMLGLYQSKLDVDAISAELRDLEREIAGLQELKEERYRLKTEFDELTSLKSVMEFDCERFGTAIEKVEDELDELDAALKVAESRLKQRKAEYKSKQQELENVRQRRITPLRVALAPAPENPERPVRREVRYDLPLAQRKRQAIPLLSVPVPKGRRVNVRLHDGFAEYVRNNGADVEMSRGVGVNGFFNLVPKIGYRFLRVSSFHSHDWKALDLVSLDVISEPINPEAHGVCDGDFILIKDKEGGLVGVGTVSSVGVSRFKALEGAAGSSSAKISSSALSSQKPPQSQKPVSPQTTFDILRPPGKTAERFGATVERLDDGKYEFRIRVYEGEILIWGDRRYQGPAIRKLAVSRATEIKIQPSRGRRLSFTLRPPKTGQQASIEKHPR